MPKKKDTESKRPKKSAASKERLAASPGHMDILPPPNPSASHLIASNPFDDPLPTPMKMHPMHTNYQGQPMSSMMRMQGPNTAMNVGGYGRGMRPPYNGSSIPPSWSSPMHSSGMMAPNHPYHPNLPPNANGYPINRPPYGMPMYRNSARVMRPGMHGSMGPDSMSDAMGMSGMGHMGPSPMTTLVRPPSQMPSPLGGRRGSSSSKESKSPKGSEGGSKRKKSDKKSMAESRLKNQQSDLDKQALMDQTIPTMNNPMPMVGVLCKKCNIEINADIDQVVQCAASCNSWYHRQCVGLTEAAYSLLRGEPNAIWACDLCLQTKEIYSVRSRMSMNMPMMANA